MKIFTSYDGKIIDGVFKDWCITTIRKKNGLDYNVRLTEDRTINGKEICSFKVRADEKTSLSDELLVFACALAVTEDMLEAATLNAKLAAALEREHERRPNWKYKPEDVKLLQHLPKNFYYNRKNIDLILEAFKNKSEKRLDSLDKSEESYFVDAVIAYTKIFCNHGQPVVETKNDKPGLGQDFDGIMPRIIPKKKNHDL